MGSSFPPKKDENKGEGLKFTKAVLPGVLSVGAKTAIEHFSKFPKTTTTVLSGGTAVLVAGGLAFVLDKYKSWHDSDPQEKSKERIKEAKRRLGSTRDNKSTKLVGGLFPHFIIDGLKVQFEEDAAEEIELKNIFHDGIPTAATLRPTDLDTEDTLPRGAPGSCFIRIKMIEYFEGFSGCAWVKKQFLEVPVGSEMIWTQLAGQESENQSQNYAEITLFKRTANGNQECGIIRLRTQHGFDIHLNGKLIEKITMKTRAQEKREQARTNQRNYTSEREAAQRRALAIGGEGEVPMLDYPPDAQFISLDSIEPAIAQKITKGKLAVEERMTILEQKIKSLVDRSKAFDDATQQLKRECAKPKITFWKSILSFFDCSGKIKDRSTSKEKIREKASNVEVLGGAVNRALIEINDNTLKNAKNALFELESSTAKLNGLEDKHLVEIQNLHAQLQSLSAEYAGIKLGLIEIADQAMWVGNDNKIPLKLDLYRVTPTFESVNSGLKI